ncbi:MAG: 5-methyltetrahydrofolate--homocysteine methyltransferase [Paracoccaceae bacterium]|jgi:5-methyltetrahydrofolate--homocysteine methyltransferase
MNNLKKNNPLSLALEEQEWLLADGATGTQLFNMGLSSGDAPELWNETNPDKIKKLYSDSITAGCDLFLTNSFGSNRSRLKLHGAGSRAFSISKIAAELAIEVSQKSTRNIILAGSMGPTGEIMHPIGPLTHEIAVEIFHEQAEGLKAGGVDVLWFETISAKEELAAAVEAAELANMAWCGTMSFDTAGRTMMGLTSPQMIDLITRMDKNLIAFGANCGVGSSDLIRTILGFENKSDSYPIIAKGNAGIPKYIDGNIHYNGTPELMADYACLARDAGARIIGGCCGTTPAHLIRMREALENRPKGVRPNLETVVKSLGEFSSKFDGTEENTIRARKTKRSRLKEI